MGDFDINLNPNSYGSKRSINPMRNNFSLEQLIQHPTRKMILDTLIDHVSSKTKKVLLLRWLRLLSVNTTQL